MARIGRTLICGLLLLALSGCAGAGPDPAEEAAAFQAAYRSLEQIQGEAEVTADYGDRAYQYSIRFAGDEETGSLTVTHPQSIAGAGAAWEGGQLSLDYEGLTLELGELSPDGLSPAEGLPAILSLCGEGVILESGWRETDSGQSLYLRLQNPREEESTLTLWADPETFALCQGDLLWEENRILSFQFNQFTLETNS